MAAPTPAEQALARSFTTGRTRFDISELSIDYHANRSVVLTYQLTVTREGHQGDEQWEVTLPWTDKSFLDVLASPAPEPERLRVFVTLVRSLLEEWWDTKGYESQSARMGRKLH
jgi:hypothetical protein